ncbi:MAG: tetratricopeptide repeat protein [Pseudohongiellaceae bacterium]
MTTLIVLLSIAAGSAAAQQAPWVGTSLNGVACSGGSPGNFGPYDYRTDKERLPVVENRHFTPQVEQLRRGETAQHPMSDASYTLVRFPNHHRALYSAVRFSLGESGYGSHDRYVAECFLQRAIHFRLNDPVPHMLYGLYLHRLGQLDKSLEKYQAAEELAPNDANLLYNMGLVYFDSGNYAESYRYAQAAYSHGIELPGLRRKLQEAGHWE